MPFISSSLHSPFDRSGSVISAASKVLADGMERWKEEGKLWEVMGVLVEAVTEGENKREGGVGERERESERRRRRSRAKGTPEGGIGRRSISRPPRGGGTHITAVVTTNYKEHTHTHTHTHTS